MTCVMTLNTKSLRDAVGSDHQLQFVEEDDDEGSSKPRASHPLDHCGVDLITEMASYLDPKSLAYFASVNTKMRKLVRYHDEYLWRPLCTSLWHGKQLLHPKYRPFLKAFETHTKVASQSPSGGVQSWQDAFATSHRDAKRQNITLEELHHGQWNVRFLTDPNVPAQAISFLPGNVLQTPGYPSLFYQLCEKGTKLHIHVFPIHQVERNQTGNWGWTIGNSFVRINSLGPSTCDTPHAAICEAQAEMDEYLRRVAREIAIAQSYCKGLEDDSDSSVDLDEIESTASRCSSFDEEASSPRRPRGFFLLVQKWEEEHNLWKLAREALYEQRTEMVHLAQIRMGATEVMNEELRLTHLILIAHPSKPP